MQTAQIIDTGLLAGAAMSYAYACTKIHRDPQTSGLAVAASGIMIVAYGYRQGKGKIGRSEIFPLAVGGALTAFGLFKRATAPAFDGGLDEDTREVALTAIAREKDPSVLHAFATKLAAAGHSVAAEAVSKRAAQVAPSAHVGQAPSVVAQVQALLRDLGYDVAVDGVLGPRTRLALERFQSLHDLDIDGIPSSETIAALRHAAGRP